MAETLTENPLREGLRIGKIAEPCVVVIFGASGDLTKRKLVPALYNLAQERLIPSEIAVVGMARSEMSDDEFRSQLKEALTSIGGEASVDETLWQSFSQKIYYMAGDFGDAASFQKLKEKLETIDKEHGTRGNRLFYLSTAPQFFSVVSNQLKDAAMNKAQEGSWVRVIIEKPFGNDLQSAKKLNKELAKCFKEEQVYRIDHYLGKETVQNLLVFRFANSIFEPLWNRQYIDHVQITNAEAVGVEGRGGYYESAGVVRDMIQNHVFQVLSLIAMEPPATLDANAVRDEKIKAMMAVKPITNGNIDEFAVRGQYGAGFVLGQKVVGYREETGVNPESSTETFAALKLYFDNWRWAGVPFYIRSGKRLTKRVTEIAIRFKDVPHRLFQSVEDEIEPNWLIIRVQPHEGITLRFGAKLPGQATRIRQVNMDFRYGSSFGIEVPEAYQRLLLDCLLGDSTLYARRDMVERGWEIVTPILEAWKNGAKDFPNYEAGSSGPQSAHDLLEHDGRKWRKI